MRIAWVHPSWRDLVIDHLARDGDVRTRYLRSSSIHGVLLALSAEGGSDGARRLPLLRSDDDWDAVNDRVYELAPSVESAELIGLLGAVTGALEALRDTIAAVEVDALARTLLSRLSAVWATDHDPIPVPELEAWVDLATRISPRPPTPVVANTWVELLCVGPPDISDYQSLERFADWLALADLLRRYDTDLLLELGFPAQPPDSVRGFLEALAGDDAARRLTSADHALRALAHIPWLFPHLAENVSWHVGPPRDRSDDAPSPWGEPSPDLELIWSGELDIARVLNDL
jgi:hypothetical protein